jgi:hypothetical protein
MVIDEFPDERKIAFRPLDRFLTFHDSPPLCDRSAMKIKNLRAAPRGERGRRICHTIKKEVYVYRKTKKTSR